MRTSARISRFGFCSGRALSRTLFNQQRPAYFLDRRSRGFQPATPLRGWCFSLVINSTSLFIPESLDTTDGGFYNFAVISESGTCNLSGAINSMSRSELSIPKYQIHEIQRNIKYFRTRKHRHDPWSERMTSCAKTSRPIRQHSNGPDGTRRCSTHAHRLGFGPGWTEPRRAAGSGLLHPLNIQGGSLHHCWSTAKKRRRKRRKRRLEDVLKFAVTLQASLNNL